MSEEKNIVLLLLVDQWCDWEASYAAAVLNSFSDYEVKTISYDKDPKKSMGGIKAAVDYSFCEYLNMNNVAMTIIPGGLSWDENEYKEVVEFVHRNLNESIPVAAICGATTFLCRNGFLNNIKHTGDNLELFQSQPGYTGEALYQEAQLVYDGGIITANETAAVQFAYEIFKILKIDTDEELSIWYDNFKYGAIR